MVGSGLDGGWWTGLWIGDWMVDSGLDDGRLCVSEWTGDCVPGSGRAIV
jgi:hypothetical protein